MNEILATKQGEVRLRDIIESEGRKEVQNLLREDIATVERELADLDRRAQDAKTRMQSFESRQRASEITSEFREAMLDSVSVLGVPTLNVSKLYVHSRITENGAALPRALLAYYYSFLRVMRNHFSSAFCPIVIDSPNQQDQDRDNNIRILTFLRDERPRDSQLILAFVSDFGVAFEGRVYALTEKYSLLSAGDYERVFGEVKVFLDQAA